MWNSIFFPKDYIIDILHTHTNIGSKQQKLATDENHLKKPQKKRKKMKMKLVSIHSQYIYLLFIYLIYNMT